MYFLLHFSVWLTLIYKHSRTLGPRGLDAEFHSGDSRGSRPTQQQISIFFPINASLAQDCWA